jgi:bile acid:Na+ symporter, BASS family
MIKIKSPLLNFITILSIPLAILIPQVGKVFSPYTSWLLGVLLFFSFLGISFDDLLRAVRKPIKPFFVSMVILIVSPLVIYPIMERFFPVYLLGAVIFMLLPTAVSSPAIAGIYGGDIAFGTVNAVFSNLLSPFTIPLFLVLFMGTSVKVSTTSMLLQLLLIVVIPFILGLLANRFAPAIVGKTKHHYRLINLLLLFLLFFAILSPYSKELTGNLLNWHLWLAVFVVHIVLYFFSKLTVLNTTNESEKISVEANMMFLNIGLAVVIVQNYFGPTEMLFIIFCEIFWVVMVGLFKYLK